MYNLLKNNGRKSRQYQITWKSFLFTFFGSQMVRIGSYYLDVGPENLLYFFFYLQEKKMLRLLELALIAWMSFSLFICHQFQIIWEPFFLFTYKEKSLLNGWELANVAQGGGMTNGIL